MFWLVAGVARTQLRMTRRNIEDWLPVFSTPLSAIITLAILMHAGRPDLAGYAIVAVVLMTLSQMGFFVGTEFIASVSPPTALSLPWGLDEVVDQLAAAVAARG